MTTIAAAINDTDTYNIAVNGTNEVTYWAPGSRRGELAELREVNGATAVIARAMGAAPAEVMEVSVFRLRGSF